MPLEIPTQNGLNRGPDGFPRPWERTAVQPMDAEALTLAMGLGKNTLIGGGVPYRALPRSKRRRACARAQPGPSEMEGLRS